MPHVLRVHFLDRPDIDGIGGPVELMARNLAPAVKAPFMVAHVIFAGEDGMFLDPDDRLGEVEPTCLQHRRVVATVGIAAPDIEGTTGYEDTRNVAKPGVQELVELRVGDKVVG